MCALRSYLPHCIRIPTQGDAAFQNPWDTYLGDCSVVDEYLADKPVRSAWLLAHYLNVFLRAVGQPAFVNNPILGAAIFASLFVKEWQVGTGCLLGGSIATLTELVGAAPFNEGTLNTIPIRTDLFD